MTALPLLSQLLQTAINVGACSGVQLAINLRGQDLDLCFGEAAPGIPMTAEHLLPWLSGGKPLTAIAWAQLWEQGKVELDEPIVTRLPEFGQRGKVPITFRHLLTHTGGFRCIVDVDGGAHDWDAGLHRVCQARLERKWIPGRRAAYQARSSWYVLGEVVQRLSDRPLDELIRERICGPADMADSWLRLSPQQFDTYGTRIAELYDTSQSTLAQAPVEVDICGRDAATHSVPGTSARGPMRDLCRFYSALLRPDGPLLRPPTLEAMVARQRSGLYDETFRHHLDWGLGFVLNSDRHGAETIPYGYGRYASPRTFGHAGARCVTGFADAENGLCVALGVNGRLASAAHVNQFREFLSALYQDLELDKHEGG